MVTPLRIWRMGRGRRKRQQGKNKKVNNKINVNFCSVRNAVHKVCGHWEEMLKVCGEVVWPSYGQCNPAATIMVFKVQDAPPWGRTPWGGSQLAGSSVSCRAQKWLEEQPTFPLAPVAELPGHAVLMVCHWFLGSLLGNTLNGFAWWQCDLLDAAWNVLAGGVDFHTGFLPDLPGTRAWPQHFLSKSQHPPASQSTWAL